MELCNAEFKIDENDKVTVNIQGLNISINFWEEINIMKEIFKDGVYNVETNDKFVFVDIGMNVGMTSLFFSKNPNTIKTYSFEPFPKTYEFARKNIDQNPSYAPKINSFNYGVGETKEEKSIDYFLDYKGSVGTDGIPDRVLDDSVKGKMTSERVVLESAETVVTKIRGENPGLKLYAKIDCEGAEYGILKQLSDKNLLKEFELIMMEWHNEGPVELVEILKKNGFISYSFWPNNNDIGMIYSFRSS
jgi:FkbM family methyltransferase